MILAIVFGLLSATLTLWLRCQRVLDRSRLAVRPVHQSECWLEASTMHVSKQKSISDGVARIGVNVIRFARLPNELSAHNVGVLTLVALGCALVQPWVAVFLWCVGIAVLWWRRNAGIERRRRCLARDVPFVVDVLRIAVESGCNITHALDYVVNGSGSSPLLCELTVTVRRIRCGERVVDALTDLGKRGGHEVAMFTSALVSCELYGSPLSSALQRLSFEVRLDQSRRQEQAARRLSVTLLFPLAGCIFPAFVLLTVVPLLAGSLGWLAVSFH